MFLTDSNGEFVESIQSGEITCFNITSYLNELYSKYSVALDVYNDSGNRVFYCNSEVVTGVSFKVSAQSVIFRCNILRIPLMPGTYYAHVSLTQDNSRVDFIENALMFTVVEGDFWRSGRFITGANPPLILVDHNWSINNV